MPNVQYHVLQASLQSLRPMSYFGKLDRKGVGSHWECPMRILYDEKPNRDLAFALWSIIQIMEID